MKKKILVYLALFLFLINFIWIVPIVSADSVFSLDYGWEYVNAGVGDGTSGLIDFDNSNAETNRFNVSDSFANNGVKSFLVERVGDDSTDILGYWNLTTNFDFISEFGYYFYIDDYDGDSKEIYMYFYDVNDVIVLQLRFKDFDLDVNSVSTGWNEIYGDLNTNMSEWMCLNFTYISGNTLNISLYSDTTNLLGYYQGSIETINDWDSFSYIVFDRVDTGSALNDLELYFDDFNITTSESGSQWESCENYYYVIEKQFDDSIAYRNTTNTLKVYWQNEHPQSGLFLQIFDSNGQSKFAQAMWYGNPKYIEFIPDESWELGTYTIKLKEVAVDHWELTCPFTLAEDNTNISLPDWEIEFDQQSYRKSDTMNIWYIVPDSTNAKITIYKDADNDGTWDEQVYYETDIVGDGGVHWIYNLFDLTYEVYGTRYWVLLSDDNDLLKASDYCRISDDVSEWELYIDSIGTFTKRVNAEDQVNFITNLKNIDENVVIRIYESNALFQKGELYKTITINNNEGYNTKKYFPANETTGVEYYYVTLYGDISGDYDDGIKRILTVFDKTDTNMDNTTDDNDTSPWQPPTGGSWYGLPYWVPFFIGIFLTLFITMSPLIIATYITRHSRMGKISLPPMLYVGFFFTGLIVSIAMSLLPIWLPFVILFSMIIYFAIQWLYGKKGEIAGE